MAKVARRIDGIALDSIMPPEGEREEEETSVIAPQQDTPPFHVHPDVAVDDPDDETFVYRNSPRANRMEGKVFDPNKHMRQLRGRGGESDYLDAKWRIVWVRSEFPDAVIATEAIKLVTEGTPKDRIAIFKAVVILPGDQGQATGFGSETESDFKDFLEKAETKAISRALQHLGYGTAFAQDDGDLVTDAPVETKRAQQRVAKINNDHDLGPAPERDEATKANNKDGLGFTPVSYEGKKIANMTQMQKAIYAAPGHDERQDLYNLAKEAGWGKPALTVIREDWEGANRADEIATVAE